MTAQEGTVSLCKPPPWPPCIPGKALDPVLLFPNPRTPKSQNSPFWKGPREITESNNAQHGSSEGFRRGKAAPAKGLCKIRKVPRGGKQIWGH